VESNSRKARIIRVLRALELRHARVQKSMQDRWLDAFPSGHESSYFHVGGPKGPKPR
jgi:hypothetical protein